MFFIIINALHVSGGPSAHHQEPIKLCAAPGIVMLSCCLLLVWMGWNAVVVRMLSIPQLSYRDANTYT